MDPILWWLKPNEMCFYISSLTDKAFQRRRHAMSRMLDRGSASCSSNPWTPNCSDVYFNCSPWMKCVFQQQKKVTTMQYPTNCIFLSKTVANTVMASNKIKISSCISLSPHRNDNPRWSSIEIQQSLGHISTIIPYFWKGDAPYLWKMQPISINKLPISFQ